MQQLHRNVIAKLERDVAALQSVSDKDFFLRIQRLMEWFVSNSDLQGVLQKIEEERNRESKEYRKRADNLKNQLTDAIKEFRKIRRENDKIKTSEEIYRHLKAAKQTLIAEDLYDLSYEEGLHQIIQQIFERLDELGIPIDEFVKKAFSKEWETYIKDWDKERTSIKRFDEYIDPIITFIKKKMEKDERVRNDYLLNDLYEDLDAYYPKKLVRGSDFDFTVGYLKVVAELLKKMQIEVDTNLIDILEKKREDFIQHKKIFLEKSKVSTWNAFSLLGLTLALHSDWSKADHITTYPAQHLVGRMRLVIGGKAELRPREREEYMEYLSTLIRFVKDYFEEATKTPMSQEEGKKELKNFEFNIAISFAGENREIAEELAEKLQRKGIRVFYDRFHKSELWGKKLTTFFQDIYGSKTKFVVVLISRYYPIKDWTDFEFSIMRAEAKKRQDEFILPVKLDDTKILGIHRDIGYLDYKEEGIDGIVDCLLGKLSMA